MKIWNDKDRLVIFLGNFGFWFNSKYKTFRITKLKSKYQMVTLFEYRKNWNCYNLNT